MILPCDVLGLHLRVDIESLLLPGVVDTSPIRECQDLRSWRQAHVANRKNEEERDITGTSFSEQPRRTMLDVILTRSQMDDSEIRREQDLRK